MWGIPAFANVAALFLSAYMLHNATYDYVHEMVQFQDNYKLRENRSENEYHLSIGIEPETESFGALNDPLEEYLGYQDIPIAVLDQVALLFPCCFLILAVLMDAIGPFTKVIVCNICLAVGKGAFGYMTTVPDSSGWANCQNRLGPEGLAFMMQDHTAVELLRAELIGISNATTGVHNKHMRWCADMMWSGHTYFTCLYALGLYDLVRLWTRNWQGEKKRKAFLFIVGGFAVTEQVVEVTLVLVNRFHYSMDVAMAILLTFLFYTNGSIGMVADLWARKNSKPMASVYTDGDVMVPPCCVPFSFCANRSFLLTQDELVRTLHSVAELPHSEVYFIAQGMNIPNDAIEKAVKVNNEASPKRNVTLLEGVEEVDNSVLALPTRQSTPGTLYWQNHDLLGHFQTGHGVLNERQGPDCC